MDYAIGFRTLAAESGWNQPALVDAFFNILSEWVKDFLTPLDLPSELDALISLAAKIEKRLLEWDRTRGHPPGPESGYCQLSTAVSSTLGLMLVLWTLI